VSIFKTAFRSAVRYVRESCRAANGAVAGPCGWEELVGRGLVVLGLAGLLIGPGVLARAQVDEAPARQLAEQWPSLPDAVQVASEEGERLLSAARDRTGWHGQEASERQEQAPTRLYDQRGDGIRDASRLDAVLDDADDAVWLVPAIALTESTGEAVADRQESSVPTTQELDCQTCGRATDHQFKTHESVPDEAWTGQPIWECRVCGSARYGPSLE
jgi:hypothetical protein